LKGGEEDGEEKEYERKGRRRMEVGDEWQSDTL
jgi:hypothetical protein